MMREIKFRDKNGVEIYDGDLLRIPAKSTYEEKTFTGSTGYEFTPESISLHGFEIIGNIYENGDLLNTL